MESETGAKNPLEELVPVTSHSLLGAFSIYSKCSEHDFSSSGLGLLKPRGVASANFFAKVQLPASLGRNWFIESTAFPDTPPPSQSFLNDDFLLHMAGWFGFKALDYG